jgi:phospho-N-acetylmuramoyl-pentapeptide-transferase
MIYQLFTYLSDVPGARLMTYISFRAVVAGVLAMCISIWFGKKFIEWQKRKNISETQRDVKDDPFNVNKKGVPTMGGVVIIVATLLPSLLVGKLTNIYMILMLITTVLLGTLGFVDDYKKTFHKNKDGINGWVKIAGQILLGLIVGLTLRYSPQAVMNERVTSHIENNVTVFEKSPEVKSTRTTIPFFKDHNLNYADLFSWMGEENKYRAGWICFVVMTILVVVSVSNGANLNDGMDGMCAGNSALMGIGLLILAYISGNVVFSDYFDVMYIPGSEELTIFLASFVGALIGFLWWNGFPAQIFMGDTGSLTIGGIIAVSAVIIHKELLLPIICGIFVIESLSVVLQTQVYRFSKKKGNRVRIWRRTPIHDHFRTSMEKVTNIDPTCKVLFKNDSNLLHENKIVLRFCIVTLILVALAILTLKIR